jgi:hypothetical protein
MKEASMEMLLTSFWDTKDILLLEFQDHVAIVNANHCCTTMWNIKDAKTF